MGDWLENIREKGTFVHKNTAFSLRHELKRGEHFSDYFLNGFNSSDPLIKLRKAREIAQNTVNITTDQKIMVRLGGNGSYTDGKSINISSDYFNDKNIPYAKGIDILTGFSVHEAAHINYTDFKGDLDYIEATPAYLRELKHTICNIIEDERIEYLTGEKYPGMSDFLGVCKEYAFAGFDEKQNEMLDPLAQFINIFLLVIRYPASVTESMVAANYENLVKIKNVLTPYPKTSENVRTACDKIIDIIKELIAQQLMKQSQQGGNSQEQDGESKDDQKTEGNGNDQSQEQDQDGNQDEGQNQGQGQKGKKSQESSQEGSSSSDEAEDASEKSEECGDLFSENDNQQGSSTQNSDADGNGAGGTSQNKNNKGNESNQSKQKKPSRSEIRKALEEALNNPEVSSLLSEIRNASEKSQSDSKSGGNAKELYYEEDAEFVNGISELTGESIPYIKNMPSNPKNYLDSVAKVRRYIPAVKKALKIKTEERDYELHGTTGKLNFNKLANAQIGNKSIFRQTGTRSSDKASICILIDESGSMSGNNIIAARDTAILINEAVKNIEQLELFVYGYSESQIKVYGESRRLNKFCMGSINDPEGGTPTGEAMKIVGERVKKLSKENCLMIVITDGRSDNGNLCRQMDNYLREKLNIEVIAVGICNNQSVKKEFKNSIVQDSIATLASELSKLIKTKLLKKLKRHSNL